MGNKLESYWKQVKKVGKVENLDDDDAMLALGSVYGQMKAEIKRLKNKEDNVRKPIPAEDWHEDDGDVLWWVLPVIEPPYCGSPLDVNFKYNYYTHFTRIFMPYGYED